MDDLGIALMHMEKARELAAQVDRPLRAALALSRHPRGILILAETFRDALQQMEHALKAQLEEAQGLIVRPIVTDEPKEDERDV